MNMTELWFLRNTLDAGGGKVSPFAELTVTTPKFGYDQCYVDVDTTRYLIKHKTWAEATPHGSLKDMLNVVFYVQKHKRQIK